MADTSLDNKTQDAVIAWILDEEFHGYSVGGIKPRRWEQAKYDPTTGLLDPKTLPAILVQASQQEQLHAQVQTWRFEVRITLECNADDTPAAKWDALNLALESILSVADLAGGLSDDGDHYLCQGVVSRNLGSKQEIERHWQRVFILSLWATHNPGS